MNRRWGRMALAGLSVFALAGQAAASDVKPPDGLVWMVLREINADTFDRDDPTNRAPLVLQPPEGMLRPVDVSPDGRSDWIVDFEAAELSAYCGTGGCSRLLYVSDGDDGFIRAFDAQALTFEITRRDGEVRLDIQAHHLNCRPEQTECGFSWAWDQGLRRLVERPTQDGTTRLQGGGFQPIERALQNLPDDLPPELSEAWFEGRRACQAYTDDGVVILRPEFDSIPDINGDGRRDWVETPAICADLGVERSFRLWVTDHEGALKAAYESEGGRYPSLDIAATPATVLVNPACGYGEPCPDVPLRWDAATGRFEIAQ